MNWRRLELVGLALAIPSATTAAIGLGVAILSSLGYCVTETPSVPRGLWQTTQAPLTHGQIVSFCPPDTPVFRILKTHGYAKPGNCPGNYAQFFKPIAALPGDTVELSEAGVRVNGQLLRNSKPLKGRPYPIYPFGTYTVAPDTVWLVSHYVPGSVDARYFGPLPISAIRSPIKPVWTEYAP